MTGAIRSRHAAAALLLGLGIVSATTLGPAETPPASTTSVRPGTVELEVVVRTGPNGFTTPVRGRFELAGSDLWVLVVTTDPDDVTSRVDRLTWTADGQEREVSAP